jgi:hypothetical protein
MIALAKNATRATHQQILPITSALRRTGTI